VNGEYPGAPTDRRLEESTVYALDYIAKSPIEKLYTFKVSDNVLKELQEVAAEYMFRYVGHRFKSLEVLESLC
jgi:DNA repair protein RecO (recombination protein O)